MASPLVPIFLSWMLGLLLGTRVGVGWPLLAGGALVALIAAIGVAARGDWPEGGALAHPPLAATLLLTALLAGGARAAQTQPGHDERDLASYNDGGRVTLVGVVARYPERRGARTQYELEAERLDGRPVRGRLLVTLAPYPSFDYGDRLELEGELVTPPVLDGFDYQRYLADRGIFSLLRGAGGRRVGRGAGAPIYTALFALRARAERVVHRILPEPHAALLGGILLGIESGIPERVMESFSRTGTTHVLVISGSNFAILAAIFLLAGRRLLGPRAGAAVAIVGMGLYALLVGGDPPVMRAAIMGIFSLVALLTRREGVALNTLALAALAMTAARPGQLYDVGFQLSALATLGLILGVEPLAARTERLLERARIAPGRRRRLLALLSDALLLTVAAQIITTPLVVGTFGRLSTISLAANLLIVPVQGWLLATGGLATLAGLVWLPAGQVLAALPYVALAWTLTVVEWGARLPLASVELAPRSPTLIWGLYALWGLAWWLRDRLPRPGLAPGLRWGTLVALALLPWWIQSRLPDGRLHLYVLDVGQGDAILIVTPHGHQLLVDGGPDPTPLLEQLGRRVPPWDRRLEGLILTHPDADHLGGFPEVLSRYEAGLVIDSGQPHDSALYGAWEAALDARALEPQRARPGQRLALGSGATLELLAPADPLPESLNDGAVVARLRYGAFCALLTGDIEAAAERALLARGAIEPCALLKVAHHGSATSSTPEFLAAARPAIALISAGRENRYGHPDAEVVERLEQHGARVLRTDRDGTLHLITDGARLWVATGR